MRIQVLINDLVQIFKSKKFYDAIRLAEIILEETPKNIIAANVMSRSLNLTNRKQKSIEFLHWLRQIHGESKWIYELEVQMFRTFLQKNEEFDLLLHILKLYSFDFKCALRALQLAGELKRNEIGKELIRLIRVDERNFSVDFYRFEIDFYKDLEFHDIALEKSSRFINENHVGISDMHQHAVLLRLNGFAKQAIGIFQNLLKDQSHYAIHHNLGNCYSDLGMLSLAIPHYEKSIYLNPRYLDSHRNLNRIIWELGNKNLFGKSLEVLDTNSYLQQFKASVYNEAKLFEVSLNLLETIAESERSKEWYYLCSRAFRGIGEFQKSIEIFDNYTFTKSEDFYLEKAISLFELGEYKLSKDSIAKVLEINSNNQLALAYEHACKKASCESGVAVEQYTKSYFLFESISQKTKTKYLDELRESLGNLHKSVGLPLNQSVENGTQTKGHLFSMDVPSLQELKLEIDRVVFNFIDAQGMDKKNLIKNDGTPNYVGSWSVRLEAGGFHHNHIHSHGQISGVVYITVPNEVNRDNLQKGWLKLGQVYSYSSEADEPDLLIRPEPLKCVLFRSCVWHGTNVFDEDALRLSIAFDVGKYGVQ